MGYQQYWQWPPPCSVSRYSGVNFLLVPTAVRMTVPCFGFLSHFFEMSNLSPIYLTNFFMTMLGAELTHYSILWLPW